MRLLRLFICVALVWVWFLGLNTPIQAATVTVTGKAKSLNTGNSYLDFTNYNSNVTIDNTTGTFSGYAFSEDLGWVAFGSTDNTQGPVSVNLTTGVVTGKAKVLLTEQLLDFTNYNSNVTANLSTGVFSGFVFSEDMGWFDFSDTGVSSSATLDSVSPDFYLDSPGDYAYTSSSRPSFRWQAASDQIGTITKYRLDIDNGDSGDFVIDNIPAQKPDTYETSTYVAKYEGFSDSDTTNNYITVYTKSSSDWSTTSNDGKLIEGKRIWTVGAYDSNGNVRTKSRTLFADFSSPSVELSKVNEFEFTGSDISTADTTPTFSGRVVDSLAGDSVSNSVASGPKSLTIKFEKRNYLGEYTLYAQVEQSFSQIYWTIDYTQITDNKEQKSAKYAPFNFTPQNLETGTYRVTISGSDIAGQTGQLSFALIISPPGIAIPFVPRTEPEPTEVSAVPPPGATPLVQLPEINLPQIGWLDTLLAGWNSFWTALGNLGQTLVAQIQNIVSGVIALAQSVVNNTLAFVQNIHLPQLPEIELPTIAIRLPQLPKISLAWLNDLWQALNRDINALALTFENFLATILQAPNQALAFAYDVTGRFIAYVTNVLNAGQQNLAAAISQGENFGQHLKHWFEYSFAAFNEIVLDQEPTRITNVQITETGADYAVITWETNHYTKNNKVNFGETTSYGRNAFADDYQKIHTVRLTELKPNTKYVFEVMSQNKNYIYDAHHEFSTLP